MLNLGKWWWRRSHVKYYPKAAGPGYTAHCIRIIAVQGLDLDRIIPIISEIHVCDSAERVNFGQPSLHIERYCLSRFWQHPAAVTVPGNHAYHLQVFGCLKLLQSGISYAARFCSLQRRLIEWCNCISWLFAEFFSAWSGLQYIRVSLWCSQGHWIETERERSTMCFMASSSSSVIPYSRIIPGGGLH